MWRRHAFIRFQLCSCQRHEQTWGKQKGQTEEQVECGAQKSQGWDGEFQRYLCDVLNKSTFCYNAVFVCVCACGRGVRVDTQINSSSYNGSNNKKKDDTDRRMDNIRALCQYVWLCLSNKDCQPVSQSDLEALIILLCAWIIQTG